MTFLETNMYTEKNALGQSSHFKLSRFKCDQCEKSFEKRSAKNKYINSPHHFCSSSCAILSSRRGGIVYEFKRKSCLEKYGVEHHLQNEEIQKKRIDTCIELFGGRAPMSSEEIRKKSEKTNQERYNGHFSKTEKIKKKRRETCLKKYGVDSFSKTKEFKEKVNWQQVNTKGFETRKKNGMSPVSKIEEKFGDFLRSNFKDVHSQIQISNWWIDFYIPSKDVYVQFDGDYWHGLNKTTAELLSSKNPRDRVIAGTRERDRQKERWFEENGYKLVRIFESQFKKEEYREILKMIEGKTACNIL